jgi:mannose-6-phosphate isomerase-like protein (cupin superfamily)
MHRRLAGRTFCVRRTSKSPPYGLVVSGAPLRVRRSSFRVRSRVGYSIVSIADVEPAGPGGAVRFLRRELGVEAFGVNWFELPPNAEGRRHDEMESRQEEVNIIIRGDGIYRVDGEEVPVSAPMILRFDAETTRQPVAGASGMTMIAVGARKGSYEPRGPF